MAVAIKRSLLIDSLKGFAILLVILGHSIQSYTMDFDNNFMFLINLFFSYAVIYVFKWLCGIFQ